MSFREGENVGPYRVIAKLGQGGMATVFKAYHPALDRYVAIKVLHPAFMQDPNFLARFQREARVVAKLDHPNIGPIYDYAEHSGLPYLVMKFIEGETLKARLIRSGISAGESFPLMEAVGSALAYAHQRGILHRDIKPSNILLSPEQDVYLADFGLARIAEAGQSTLSSDRMLGTPQYISPEQALGNVDLDEGTDIYSLGIVLYEIAVGKVPFYSDTPFSIIHDHIYTPLPLPSQINPLVDNRVEQVLLKALAKERADRFQRVEDLVEAYRLALQVAPDEIAGIPVVEWGAIHSDPGLEKRTPEEAPAGKEQRNKEIDSSAVVLPSELEVAVRAAKNHNWIWVLAGLALSTLCLFAFLAVFSGSNAGSDGPTGYQNFGVLSTTLGMVIQCRIGDHRHRRALER